LNPIYIFNLTGAQIISTFMMILGSSMFYLNKTK